jgi:hypothetical protein
VKNKLYTVRPKDTPGGLVGITECPDVEVEEICRECYERGVIWHVHGENEEHRGTEGHRNLDARLGIFERL